MKIIKSFSSLLLLALVIRLLIMPFLFHPDIKTQYFHAQFLAHGIFNIYHFLRVNKNNLGYKDTFNYPPLVYYFLGSWNFLMHPFLGNDFYKWVNYWGENGYTSVYMFRYMFLLKIPYLIADFLTGIILASLLDQKFRKRAIILWFFNPITLYIIYGLSNFDILPTFLTLLSVYLLKKEKFIFSGLSLGGGIALKMFPALFVPFFLIFLYHKKQYRGLVYFFAAMSTFFLLTVIFLFTDFLTISQSGLLTMIFNLKINFVIIQIPLFILGYGIILLWSVFKSDEWKIIPLSICAVCFLIDSVTIIHPQWFIWGIPFFLIFAAENLNLLFIFSFLVIGYLGYIVSFGDNFLTLGLLSPVLGGINDISGLEQTILSKVDKASLQNTSQIIMSITSTVYLFNIAVKLRLPKKSFWKEKILNYEKK